MHFPSAVLTNSITNGLHASVLVFYFFGSLYHFLKTKKIKSILIVIAFLCLLVVKVLGVIVHYYIYDLSILAYRLLWSAIAMALIVLNYSILYGQKMPTLPRRIVFAFSTLLCIGAMIDNFFVDSAKSVMFFYLAIAALTVYAFVIYYSRRGVRFAFICLFSANVFWIITRSLVSLYIVNINTHPEYAYDNDIYHLMLILSTSLIYFAILKGDWVYPEKSLIF